MSGGELRNQLRIDYRHEQHAGMRVERQTVEASMDWLGKSSSRMFQANSLKHVTAEAIGQWSGL